MLHVPLSVGGVSRRYWLAAPDATPGGPLVVFLHGTGATARWADGETGWSAFLAPRGVPLALPEGLPPDPRKISKFLTNPQRWNDGARPLGHPLASGADDVAFLDAVLDDALARTGADPARVLLCGFSNGAGMAFRYAAERAERVAALAAVCGYNPVKEPRPSRPVPTLVLLGGADPLIPPDGGTVRTPWGTTEERPSPRPGLEAWARAVGAERLTVRVTPGLGHHWPGGKGQLGEEWGGPLVPVERGALEQVWEFFTGSPGSATPGS